LPDTDHATRPDRAVGDGVAVMLPFLVGYAPFALAIGAAVAAHGDRLAGWSGSWLVYGGSAHLATLRTMETSGLVVAILTGVLINARLVIYSASLSQRWQGQPSWFRLLAAPLVIDPTWAVTDAHSDGRTLAAQRRFFVAAGLTLGAGWSALIGIGVLAGDRIDARHLAVAAPLCLASLVGPRLLHRDTQVVCATAAAVTVLTTNLPAGTGIVAAVAAGCAAGALADRSDG
jgi:predicted branched-subunit amino acid permease